MSQMPTMGDPLQLPTMDGDDGGGGGSDPPSLSSGYESPVQETPRDVRLLHGATAAYIASLRLIAHGLQAASLLSTPSA